MVVHPYISVCTGVGMLDHGVNTALGGTLQPMLYVEREAFCAANLAWQMESGFLAPAPVWSDIGTVCSSACGDYLRTAFDGEVPAFLIGGIPCQPWSKAGRRRGVDDERDLWPETFTITEKYRPRVVFLEEVSGFANEPLGAERVKRDLESLDYRVAMGLFTSKECGANHDRERVFILGYTENRDEQRHRLQTDRDTIEDRRSGGELADARGNGDNGRNGEARHGRRIRQTGKELADSTVEGSQGRPSILGRGEREPEQGSAELPHYAPGRDDFGAWSVVAEVDSSLMPAVERDILRVADGMAARADRIRAIGNGVDPLAAAFAFVTLWACRDEY